MPKLSIIIPHKSTPSNDLALRINIAALLANTCNSYELIIDTECPKDPYKIWNEASRQARGDILIFTNSDVIMAPDWDCEMVNCAIDNRIVTGYLVEPGNIGVASQNIALSFGKTPETFDQAAFEKWAANQQHEAYKIERGWYMPCAMNRDWFLSTGRFDTTLAFPNPNDIIFWEHCIAQYGTVLIRAKSYAYHFQNLSGR